MLPDQSPGGTALCPGLWAAAGLWGTCMPSAGVKVPTLGDFPAFGAWSQVLASTCMSSLLWDCLCLLHVKKTWTCHLVCASMQDGEEWAWGI